MGRPERPSPIQVRRRRFAALGLLAALLVGVGYLLATTVFTTTNEELARRNGDQLLHITVHSKAVGRDLGVNVIVPPLAGPRGRRGLLVFLHGRGGYEGTFNDAVLRGLPLLHGHGPVIAFPAGGDHGYWHNRAEGDWDAYVVDEVIPLLERRFGVDRKKLAIGGISMGGFGAYDIALHHPGLFCAVGGHSPALWFEGGETAPGAFDDLADFERNDVVGRVSEDPDAFGGAKVWNDYGSEDDFRVYDEGFVAAMSRGSADFTTHSWPGAHTGGYWNDHWPDYQRFYVRALSHCG